MNSFYSGQQVFSNKQFKNILYDHSMMIMCLRMFHYIFQNGYQIGRVKKQFFKKTYINEKNDQIKDIFGQLTMM